jgi:hypothetical protein
VSYRVQFPCITIGCIFLLCVFTLAARISHKVVVMCLCRLASTGDVLSIIARDSQMFQSYLANFTAQVTAVVAELASLTPIPQGEFSQLYSDLRQDHCLCGSDSCYNSNTNHVVERVEGYQPAASQFGAIQMYSYFNGRDNHATTDPTPPTGYHLTSFKYDGYVLSVQQGQSETNVSPLSVYYNEAWGDYMTVATEAGRQYAQENSYKLVNETVSPLLCSCE